MVFWSCPECFHDWLTIIGNCSWAYKMLNHVWLFAKWEESYSSMTHPQVYKMQGITKLLLMEFGSFLRAQTQNWKFSLLYSNWKCRLNIIRKLWDSETICINSSGLYILKRKVKNLIYWIIQLRRSIQRVTGNFKPLEVGFIQLSSIQRFVKCTMSLVYMCVGLPTL